jgi:hypothetical protein
MQLKRRKSDWKRSVVAAALGLLVVLWTLACESSTESAPPIVDESELEFVPRAVTAPPLATMDTSFWAVKGQDRELEIRYAGSGTGKKFIELVIEEETLLRRPDGSLFAEGDSIEIQVTVDPELFVVRLEPSGLQFNPNEPAMLEIDYDEAEDDFLVREDEFDVWKQEGSGDPWERLASTRIEELDEIEILLLSFTRYGLAVGR